MTARFSDDFYPAPRHWHSPAYDAACAALEARAAKTVRTIIKERARAYALRPCELDAIIAGLMDLTPGALVRLLRSICAPPHWRYFGFGGEHPALNLRGAMLYARYSRARGKAEPGILRRNAIARQRYQKARRAAA